MFNRLGQLAVVMFLFGCMAQASFAQQAVTGSVGSAPQKQDPKSLSEKASYLLGRQSAGKFKMISKKLNMEKFIQGIRDELGRKDNPIKAAEAQAVMMSFQKSLNEYFVALGKANAKEGKDFLAKNKNQPNVKQLENGIQYTVLKQGNGAIPKVTDVVKVHYVGTFLDGKEFDSSIKRGEPATFPLNRVIRGWTTTVSRMKIGSKWKIFIPGELAYGPNGQGEIGPNKLLVFEIELLGIVTPNSGSTAPIK